jgi:hypothetical protein
MADGSMLHAGLGLVIHCSVTPCCAASAPPSGNRSFELRDHGERGAGRLTLVIRRIAGRVSAEWYALFYRRWKCLKAELGSYPTMTVAGSGHRGRPSRSRRTGPLPASAVPVATATVPAAVSETDRAVDWNARDDGRRRRIDWRRGRIDWRRRGIDWRRRSIDWRRSGIDRSWHADPEVDAHVRLCRRYCSSCCADR